jgi:hypothetical protein
MAIKIKKLSTTGGYLEKASIEFADGLNCIIGSRGTCKSTVVETIRFLFDADREKVDEMVSTQQTDQSDGVSHRGLIAVTLGGATARCEVVDTGIETQSMTIERDVGTDSRIYKDGVKQLADQDILRCVEIYSQGELQRIAEEPRRRLELIDRPNQKKISELQKNRGNLAGKLKRRGTTSEHVELPLKPDALSLKPLKPINKTWPNFKRPDQPCRRNWTLKEPTITEDSPSWAARPALRQNGTNSSAISYRWLNRRKNTGLWQPR